jgi:hypothetical protein
MDQNGDWEEAIRLLENSPHRWPAHKTYIDACIAEIKTKLSRLA